MALVENIIGLNGNKVVNQFVVRIGSNTYFQSYDSIIARVDYCGNVAVSPRWCYSTTTSKYFYKFLRDRTRYQVHSKKEVQRLIDKGEIKVTLDYRSVA